MRINKNTTLDYIVTDEKNHILEVCNTRNEANNYIRNRDEHGEDTTLWSVVPQKIEESYYLTDNDLGENSFCEEIETLSDLIEGLRAAKAEGNDHIHLQVLGRVNDAPCNTVTIAEVVIPLTKEYHCGSYTFGI